MISSEVVIITRSELKGAEDAAFKRGVERGKFEAGRNAILEEAAKAVDATPVKIGQPIERTAEHHVAIALLYAAKNVRDLKTEPKETP